MLTLQVPLRRVMEYMIQKIMQKYPHHHHKKKRGKSGAVAPMGGGMSVAASGIDSLDDGSIDFTNMDMDDDDHTTLSHRRGTDEFSQVQTVRSTMMRAARLDKAQKSMDFVLPNEETALIMLQADAGTSVRPSSLALSLSLSLSLRLKSRIVV